MTKNNSPINDIFGSSITTPMNYFCRNIIYNDSIHTTNTHLNKYEVVQHSSSVLIITKSNFGIILAF